MNAPSPIHPSIPNTPDRHARHHPEILYALTHMCAQFPPSCVQGGLPERIVALIPTFNLEPSKTELHARLPERLRGEATSPAIKSARATWLAEISSALAVHAARERCEALGLLVMLRYMPLHHTSDPESLDPLSDLLTSHGGSGGGCRSIISGGCCRSTCSGGSGTCDGGIIHNSDAGCDPGTGPPAAALYALLAGKDAATLGPLLDALAPLFEAKMSPTGSPTMAAWAQRAEQLATITLMAAMYGEKEYCQLHTRPLVARTDAARVRHAGITLTLLDLGRSTRLAHHTAGGSPIGLLLITWCVVILEAAPAATVSKLASELAVAGEALDGLSWAREMLGSWGFRHDNPPEELSSIARQLLFDLVAGMLSQQRFRGDAGALPPLAPNPADTGWPAHSEQVLMLMAAVLEGRPALCRTFWSDPECMAEGSLSSLLINARFPLHVAPLATLLAALCADADSAARAWNFAHGLQRICHRVPRQFSLFGIRLHGDGLLRTEVCTSAQEQVP